MIATTGTSPYSAARQPANVVFGAKSPFFGQNIAQEAAQEAAEAAAGKRPVGLLQSLRILFEHVKHADNRQMLLGMGLKYGPTLLLLAAPLLLPFEIALLPALAVSGLLSKHGDSLINKVDKTKNAGPLHTLEEIQRTWKGLEQHEDAPAKIVALGKKLLDQLFPDDNTRVATVRERLKRGLDSRVFDWLSRAYYVRRATTNTWQGRLLDKLGKFAGRIPFKPLRLPVIALKYLIQGVMMFTRRNVMKTVINRVV